MPERSTKARSKDVNEIAASIARQATGPEPIQGRLGKPAINPAAVELVGGKALGGAAHQKEAASRYEASSASQVEEMKK